MYTCIKVKYVEIKFYISEPRLKSVLSALTVKVTCVTSLRDDVAFTFHVLNTFYHILLHDLSGLNHHVMS